MKVNGRTKHLDIRVSNEELTAIKKRVELCRCKSASELCRHMMLHGLFLEYDKEELKKIRRAVMGVANNINQIAFRVNSSSRIYKQELYELQEGVNKIWQQLNSIQSELQKLSQLNT